MYPASTHCSLSDVAVFLNLQIKNSFCGVMYAWFPVNLVAREAPIDEKSADVFLPDAI